MKFSQKIFLITFAFVTISINIIGIIIINNNYQTSIKNRIENNKVNIHNIESMLGFYNTSEIDVSFFNKNNTYYEIYYNDIVVFSNIRVDMSEIEGMLNPTENTIEAIIFNDYLFETAKVDLKTDLYTIVIVENIKDIMDIRQEQIYFFIKVSIIFSFIIAFCLYIVIHFLTRRINKLNKTVNKIAKGNYSARVKNLGKDEIGNLAKSFNKMANSVEKNIYEIQRVSENRKNFIHDITHEIRTPLTSIIGYSSLIKNKKVTDIERIQEYNNKIYEEGNYLNSISQRLTDIVLLDNQKVELQKINISETIKEIVESMMYDYKDVKFIQEIQQNIEIESDKVLLHSLVSNLVKNAIMAYENTQNKIVEIVLQKIDENKILLKIIDKGKGMSKEQLQKVTEPFYTLNKDRNRKISGMGLGLPLCIKICKTLNSNLKLESKLGEGTCVNIEFGKEKYEEI